MTSTSHDTEGELSLTIAPQGHIEWRGPRAKLEAIGAVPPTVKWPRSVYYAYWEADGAAFTLHRCRPDGLNGPMRGWTTCDWWCVQCFPPQARRQRSRIYPPHVEIGRFLSQALRFGEDVWLKFSTLDAGERIERHKARLSP